MWSWRILYRALLIDRVAIAASVFPPLPISFVQDTVRTRRTNSALLSRAAYNPPPVVVSFPRALAPISFTSPLASRAFRSSVALLSATSSLPRARTATTAALFRVPAAFVRPTLLRAWRAEREGRKTAAAAAAVGRREECRCRCMHIDGGDDDVRGVPT